MAKTNAERQKDWRAKNRSVRGMTLKQVWVLPKYWAKIQAAIAQIQGGAK